MPPVPTVPEPDRSLTGVFRQLVNLQEEFKAAAADLTVLSAKQRTVRLYEWEPVGVPQLPALWNTIDDGSYEIVDTMTSDTIVVWTVTIAVAPKPERQPSMSALLPLTDCFNRVVDKALWLPRLSRDRVLEGTVVDAKRVISRSIADQVNGVPFDGMQTLIQTRIRGNPVA